MQFRILGMVSVCLLFLNVTNAQKLNWTGDGLAFTRIKEGNIVRFDPRSGAETIVIKKESLTPPDSSKPLALRSFEYSTDNTKLLAFTNTTKVWRYHTAEGGSPTFGYSTGIGLE